MRLLDTSSYELTEFVGENIPPYAILSHTWGEGEVLFRDIENKTAQSKKGFKKLVGCCKKAAEDGFKWVWIDTCCIDKTSSAELSEAINSMYQWYKDSIICYAYLEDVTEAKFAKSRWFTRGWTLQELIAPGAVEFYTSTWEEIGTKRSLTSQIKTVTGIPTRVLRGESVLMCNAAERMSWASKRQTTRREDMAYCLMGLFQINMPLLYGEGDKAFMRLQEQILRQEEDYSIFAWTLQENCFSVTLTGCLASSPSQFASFAPRNVSLPSEPGGKPIFPIPEPMWGQDYLLNASYDSQTCRVMRTKNYECYRRPGKGLSIGMPPDPPELTARGIRITLPLRPAPSLGEPDMAWIYCEEDDRLICMLLQPTERGGTHVLARVWSSWLISVNKSLWSEFELAEVFLFPHGIVGESWPSSSERLARINKESTSGAQLELTPAIGYSAHVVSMYPYTWEENEFHFGYGSYDHGLAVIECIHDGQDTATRFQIGCGVLHENPWCSIDEMSGPEMEDEPEDEGKLLEDMEIAYEQFERLRKEYENGSLTTSDRAAEPSMGIPGMVVSATIRKRLGGQMEPVQLILRVSVGELASCDGWAQVYARQEIARLEGEAGTKPLWVV